MNGGGWTWFGLMGPTAAHKGHVSLQHRQSASFFLLNTNTPSNLFLFFFFPPFAMTDSRFSLQSLHFRFKILYFSFQKKNIVCLSNIYY